ncbi:MAG: ABC transporter ATP-binding protein [Clostridia bacterium]|nr:ABC transporter ATP-binding protein [Clostridia bacterium]
MKIELRGVTKQYLYGAKVLTSVDLSVASGEIIALLGCEGAGKTTLLKIIAGVESISEGEVLFDGEKKLLKSDDVIMLFDDGALFKRWNVFDNLAYSLKIRNVEKQEIAEKILRVADDLDITSLLSFRPSQLTLADKKRVSLARLLLRESKVILIDDIGDGLDYNERKALWIELSSFLKNSNKTVIFSTTLADEASSISDRIVALYKGEFKQVATSSEIYNHPESIWALEQLDENFSFDDGILVKEDDILCLQIGELQIAIPKLENRLISKQYVGRPVLFGVHGEDFELCENGVECEVELCLGLSNGDYILHFSNGWKMISNKKLDGTVKIAPKSDKLFLFDKTSEGSILK